MDCAKKSRNDQWLRPPRFEVETSASGCLSRLLSAAKTATLCIVMEHCEGAIWQLALPHAGPPQAQVSASVKRAFFVRSTECECARILPSQALFTAS